MIMGPSIALKDMINDGHIDIVVPTFDGSKLLMNDGTGCFSVVALPSRSSRSEEVIAFDDMDQDGCMILFIFLTTQIKFCLTMETL